MSACPNSVRVRSASSWACSSWRACCFCVPVSIVVRSVTDNSLGGVAFGMLWVVAVVVAYWWLYPRSDRKAGRTARHARP